MFTGPARSQPSSLAHADAVRIAEAYRLAGFIGDTIWPGWSQTPFPILLLTEEKDVLVGHPGPTSDFASEGVHPVIEKEVFTRPRTTAWSSNFLATFPAVGGIPTVVIGPAEATGLSSTRWVVILLHEHFHQYQYTWPGYYPAVDRLDLSGGDQSGMWMLNYAFPYEDSLVAARVALLRDAVVGGDSNRVREAMGALRSGLEPPDYRYLAFQVWQEGVSRYTEYAVAKRAAAAYVASDAFRTLDDAQTFASAYEELRAMHDEELAGLDLASQARTVFYPLGAALALVLDEASPGWRSDYLDEGMDLAAFMLER